MASRLAWLRSPLAIALAYGVLLHAPGSAHAICRVVLPVEVSGGVQFDPTTMVLYVLAPDQIVDYACPDGEAGAAAPPPDAGAPDAGAMLPIDPFDQTDAGSDDAGLDDDAGLLAPVTPDMSMEEPDMTVMPPLTPPPPASECANGADPQPVRGSVVHMVVQPAVLSTQGHAGLIMPVPARPDIHAPSNGNLFVELGSRLQPRVETETEYIEDESLGYQCYDPKSGGSGGGCFGGDDDAAGDDYDYGQIGDRDSGLYDPDTDDAELQMVMIGDDVVRFEEALSTPDYDVQVINASSVQALSTWLALNGFAHDAEDDAAFSAYVKEGAWFVALDVHPAGDRLLQPLVVSFRSDSIPLLHRLQYDSGGGELVTDAFVMAPWRMDARDGSAETLYAAPAGFGGAASGFGLSQGWLTRLKFTRDTTEWMADSELGRSGGALEVRPVQHRTERVLVPLSQCPSSRDDSGEVGGCVCSAGAHSGASGTLAPVMLACAWLALRGRRRRAT